MALANDCYRSTEFSETMITRLETVLDLPWLTTAIEKVRESSNGFLKVAKIAYGNLIEFPISDTKRALVLMYCPQWYDQELMRMIIGTFEDYLTDYQLHLSEYLFTKLTSDCLDKFAVVYIECFTNKAGKFKMPLALDKMKCDLEMATTFFTKFKPAKKVKSVFDPIEKIIAFLEASPDLAFLDFYTLWKSYPDVSLTFIEDILLKRDDVTKVQAKEIMEACTLKVKDDVRIGEITPTVFSKLHK